MEITSQDISKDKEFVNGLTSNLSEESIKAYRESVLMFCRINNKLFAEMIEEIKEEQYDRIEDNKVIRYNPETGVVNTYFNNLIRHYKEEGLSNNTLNIRLSHVRTMMKRVGIILPPKPKLPQNKTHNKERIISRGELSNILEYCDVWKKSYITFLASTGMRAHDFVNLTIDDFIDATFDYHNIVDVDEFIDEAPKDMIGYWVFTPHKTQRLGLECRVCNTPESSNHILETLRIRKDRLSRKGEKLKGDDPLFTSQNNGYNRKLLKKGLSHVLWRLNKDFQKQMQEELLNELKNKEISRKEYKKRMENLPRLHPHGLRKFFTTTVRNYTTNRDISIIMEGHTSPYKMDKHYVGANDELFSDDKIKETYAEVIPYLTFQKEISSEDYYKLLKVEKKYMEQLSINDDLREKINEMEKLITNVLSKNSVIEKYGL